MDYRVMDPECALFKAFLRYTEEYARWMGREFTGHFSVDFLVDEGVEGKWEWVEELMGSIWPIECNPRAHTAAVLFADKSEEVAEAYLSLLGEDDHSTHQKGIVMPSSDTPGYYWIGHDLVTRILLPILYLLQGKEGVREVLGNWIEFLNHLLFWKDGTYEIWDPGRYGGSTLFTGQGCSGQVFWKGTGGVDVTSVRRNYSDVHELDLDTNRVQFFVISSLSSHLHIFENSASSTGCTSLIA